MPARQIRAVLAAAVLGAVVLAGCGGDDDATSAATSTAPATQTGPVASTPDATQPPPAATEPLPPETTATQPPATTGPDTGGTGTSESPPPGRAEEEPVRVPATFVAGDGGLTPPRITVPPFLAVEVSVSSGDGKAHTVVVGTPRAQRFEVAAGGRGAVRLPGQRAGEYAIELDGREAGTLVVGGEVGP